MIQRGDTEREEPDCVSKRATAVVAYADEAYSE